MTKLLPSPLLANPAQLYFIVSNIFNLLKVSPCNYSFMLLQAYLVATTYLQVPTLYNHVVSSMSGYTKLSISPVTFQL
jgi:hypothetical protein